MTGSTGRAFVDTNVFLYAYDASDPAKQARAQDVLVREGPRLVVSGQVLSEFYTVATRKLAEPLSPADGARAVDQIAQLGVVAIDAPLVRAGITIHSDHQVSYWDGLILAAARAAGCRELLTEDLNAGATLAGVAIVNPFADLPRN